MRQPSALTIGLYNGLLGRFLFAKPVTITKAETTAVIPLPDKTNILVDPETLRYDMARIIAHARLSEDDPLFSAHFDEGLYSEDDCTRMRDFNRLRLPLSEAWSFRTMRKYTPVLYKRQVVRLLQMLNQYVRLIEQEKQPLSEISGVCAGILAITADARLKGNKDLESLILIVDDSLPAEDRAAWKAYGEYISSTAIKAPDPRLYLPLPEIAGFPFRVRIEDRMFQFSAP